MKLLNFTTPEEARHIRLGAHLDGCIVDIACAKSWAQGARNLPGQELPNSLMDLFRYEAETQEYIRQILQTLQGEELSHLKGANRAKVAYETPDVIIYPPILSPPTIRDFYAFEQHVKTAHRIREKEVPPEWYQVPVFYYSNTSMVYGPYSTVPQPSYTEEMDFELEIACVIGKAGRNIPVEAAEEYIFGYTIMNDWSARDIQRVEMRVGLGPAKAKDFATSLGPWIVTPDELQDRKTDRPGVYNAIMRSRINGSQRSQGNWNEIHFSFPDMIARASQDSYLYPGDVLGSGTVGTGCLLELTEGKGPWLKTGDIVELEIEGIGSITNRVGEKSNRSPGRTEG